jgi:plastocyanin
MPGSTVRDMRKALLLILPTLVFVTAAAAFAAGSAGGIDPRSGGLQINLGEWAIGPEARAIRPGRVTLVVTNRGKQRHGLLIRSLGDDDAIGGDDDKVKTVRLEPGRTTRITLDLAPGKYVIECFVSHHDERGMYGILDVRHDAPLVQPKPRAANTVQIKNFAYAPATLRVRAGSTVRWTNEDSAPHTASAANGSFTSPTLRLRGAYARRFTRPGRYSYLCALHPGMRGTVVVTG